MFIYRLVLVLGLFIHVKNKEFYGCNVGRKACLGIPEPCLDSGYEKCEYVIGFTPPSAKDPNYVEIELSAHRFTPHIDYVAIGFSEDKEMGNEPATVCSFTETVKMVHLTWDPPIKFNIPASEEVLRIEHEKVKLITAKKTGDRLYCKFKQHLNKGIKHPYLADLTVAHYLLVARGPLFNHAEPRVLGAHSFNNESLEFPQITSLKVNLSE